MPIYEYSCQKCRKHHEVIQKMNDKPLSKCPDCSGKLVKNLSLSGFQLKGGGWYKDGYSSEKTKTTTPSDKKESTTPTPTTEVSKKSEPAAPTPAKSEKN